MHLYMLGDISEGDHWLSNLTPLQAPHRSSFLPQVQADDLDFILTKGV